MPGVAVPSSDVVGAYSGSHSKEPAYVNITTTHCNGTHLSIRTAAQRLPADAIPPGNVIGRHPADRSKVPAYVNIAVLSHCDAVNFSVGANGYPVTSIPPGKGPRQNATCVGEP